MKYENKEIERANRAKLKEIFDELNLPWNDTLKNDELRQIIFKCLEETPTEETPTKETPTGNTQSTIAQIIAKRRVQTAGREEKVTPKTAIAIRNRRFGKTSVADAIKQRKLGKN